MYTYHIRYFFYLVAWLTKNIEYSIMCMNDLLCLCYLRTFGTLVSNNRLNLRPVLVSVVTNSISTFGPLIDFWPYTQLTPRF